MLYFPNLEIYPSRRKIFLNRLEIKLTVKEYEILLLLAANQGHVIIPHFIYLRIMLYSVELKRGMA